MFENPHWVLLLENKKFLIKLIKVLANSLMTLPPYDVFLITVKSFFLSYKMIWVFSENWNEA